MTKNIDKVELSKMASGNLSLTLSKEISWDEFTGFFSKITRILNAKIKGKHESVESAIWILDVGGISIRLVFDDFHKRLLLNQTVKKEMRKFWKYLKLIF